MLNKKGKILISFGIIASIIILLIVISVVYVSIPHVSARSPHRPPVTPPSTDPNILAGYAPPLNEVIDHLHPFFPNVPSEGLSTSSGPVLIESSQGQGGSVICQVFWKNDFGRKLSKVNGDSNVLACCIDPDLNDSSCTCIGIAVNGCTGTLVSQLRNNLCLQPDSMLLNFAGCNVKGSHGCGVSNVTNTRSATCNRNDDGTGNVDELVVSNSQELYNYSSNASLGLQAFNESGTTVVQEDCGAGVQVEGKGTVYVAKINTPSYCTSESAAENKTSINKDAYEVKQVQIYNLVDSSTKLLKVNDNSEIMSCCLDSNTTNNCKCGWKPNANCNANSVGQVLSNLGFLQPTSTVKIIDHAGCKYGNVGCGVNTKTSTHTLCKRNNEGSLDTVVTNPQKLYNTTLNTTESNYTDFYENGTDVATASVGIKWVNSGLSYFMAVTGYALDSVNAFVNVIYRQDLDTSKGCTEATGCSAYGFTAGVCVASSPGGSPDTCGEGYYSDPNNVCSQKSFARITSELSGTGLACITSVGDGICVRSGEYNGCYVGSVSKHWDSSIFSHEYLQNCLGADNGDECDTNVNNSVYSKDALCVDGSSRQCVGTKVVLNNTGNVYINDCIIWNGYPSGRACDRVTTSGVWSQDSYCVSNQTSTTGYDCRIGGETCKHNMGSGYVWYNSCSLCNNGEACTKVLTIPANFNSTCSAGVCL